MADWPVTQFCRLVDLEPNDLLWQQTHTFYTGAFHQGFAGPGLVLLGCECPKALRDIKTAGQAGQWGQQDLKEEAGPCPAVVQACSWSQGIAFGT